MPQEKILISACFCGRRTRYNGTCANLIADNEIIRKWHEEGRLVLVCPEVFGGLPVPRPAVELAGVSGEDVLEYKGQVLSKDGEDFISNFIAGAQIVLDIAKTNNAKIAILKNRSPSCGSTDIYDGSFSNKIHPGRGVTAALLNQNNIHVFNEDEILQAADYLYSLQKYS